MSNRFIIFGFFFLTACSSSDKPRTMHTKEFAKVEATCENVDQVIAYLEEQKEQNNNRTLSAVQSIPSFYALYFLIKGEYENNLEIAAGDWEKALDKKLRELYAMRLRCRETGVSLF